MQNTISFNDIPISLLSFFGDRLSMEKRLNCFIAATEACRDSNTNCIELEKMLSIFTDIFEAAGADKCYDRALAMNRDFREQKLIRTLGRYDHEERRSRQDVYITGRGLQFYKYLQAAADAEGEGGGEVNIHEALVNARLLSAERTEDDGLSRSDALQAVYRNIFGLIARLNEFEADFTDFVELHSTKIRSASEASSWLKTILRSSYITEYCTIASSSLGYMGQTNEIARIMHNLRLNEAGIDMIVEDTLKKQRAISGETETEVETKEEAREKIIGKIKAVEEFCKYDYNERISSIGTLIHKIVKRIYCVIQAFAGSSDSSTLLSKIMAYIMMLNKTGEEVPQMISGLFHQEIISPESVKTRPSKRENTAPEEEREYEHPEEELTDSSPLISEDMHAESYINKNIAPKVPIDIRNLPVFTDRDFKNLLYIVEHAGGEDSEIEIIDDGGMINDKITDVNGYGIPRIIIRRK